MPECRLRSYIAGEWVLPQMSKTTVDAVNPATEKLIATMALCGPDDVDRAVGAASAIMTEMGAPLRTTMIGQASLLIQAAG